MVPPVCIGWDAVMLSPLRLPSRGSPSPSGGNPSKRIFDHAVLTLNGHHGELAWPSGRREALSLDPGRALRPEFQRLVHQHLN
eukprot:gene10766-13672_t